MKNFAKILLVIILISSCKKDEEKTSTSENYLSIEDFFIKNSPPLQTYTVNGAIGGTITTPQGTQITIPPNAFVLPATNIVETGEVTVRFKDIYKKSDMLLANVPTVMTTGSPLISGGEFFFKAENENAAALDLAPGTSIRVAQPIMQLPGSSTDTLMRAFLGIRDSSNGFIWQQSFANEVTNAGGEYIFDLYELSIPVDTGSWCNSDNPYYFNGLPQTTLRIISPDAATYQTQVFLLFNNINSMVHVYRNSSNDNYYYYYAPAGFDCTIVAVGEKNGNLYSAFVPITITNNLTVSYSLSKTTTDEFKARIDSLN